MELVERVAREIDASMQNARITKAGWQQFTPEAQAAIAAILQDHVIVPGEPSEEMIRAGVAPHYTNSFVRADAVDFYRAMIKAAPKVGE